MAWITRVNTAFHVQPEDGHYQAPKHVVVTYVENTLYSTNKYSCVRRVHTVYISYSLYWDLCFSFTQPCFMFGKSSVIGNITCRLTLVCVVSHYWMRHCILLAIHTHLIIFLVTKTWSEWVNEKHKPQYKEFPYIYLHILLFLSTGQRNV